LGEKDTYDNPGAAARPPEENEAMHHVNPLTRSGQIPAKAQNLLAKELWLRNATTAANSVAAWLAIPQLIIDLFGAMRPGGDA